MKNQETLKLVNTRMKKGTVKLGNPEVKNEKTEAIVKPEMEK